MVIRVNQPLTESALESLNDRFAKLLITGAIEQCGALPEEADETKVANLRRIVLVPDKHDFGTIRLLLDAINDAETEPTA